MKKQKHPNAVQLAFLSRLPLIANEAMTLGLPITSRAVHNAVRASGWEAAGDTELAALYAPNTETTMGDVARRREASQSTPPAESAGQGLSDAEIDSVASTVWEHTDDGDRLREFARAILAANPTAQPDGGSKA